MAGTDSVVQIDEGTGKYLAHVQRSVASNPIPSSITATAVTA